MEKEKPKFTPGPWHYYTFGGTEAIVFAPLVEKVSQPVAKVGYERPDFEANAHLISAAPEMYEALKGLRELVQREVSGIDKRYWNSSIVAADKALAKAEGRE